MKAKTIFLIFLTLFMLGCTSEDETNNNDENPITQNPSNTLYTQDVVSKDFSLEGIYIVGPTRDRLRTDNPSIGSLPRNTKDYFSNAGAINVDATAIIVTGQIMNPEKDVFNLQVPGNFDFGTYSFTYKPEDMPVGAIPNAILHKIETVTWSPNGVQGQDINGQTIIDLDTGKFEITTDQEGVLGFTSTNEPVLSITFTVRPNDFPRNEDGMATGNGGVNGPEIRNELFNITDGNLETPIYIFEITDGNMKRTSDKIKIHTFYMN